MNQAMMDQIRFCAFCPNVCRFYYPPQGIPQKESMAPSALAYLGLAASKGFIHFTAEVEEVLSQLDAAAACKGACPYHYDIPADLQELRQELKKKN